MTLPARFINYNLEPLSTPDQKIVHTPPKTQSDKHPTRLGKHPLPTAYQYTMP